MKNHIFEILQPGANITCFKIFHDVVLEISIFEIRRNIRFVKCTSVRY